MLTRIELKDFFKQALFGAEETSGVRFTKADVFHKESTFGNGRCGICQFYLNGGACQKVIGATTREMVCHRYHIRK